MQPLLDYIGSFVPLSAADRERIARLASTKSFARHEQVFGAGKVPDRLFVLATGLIRVYYLHEDREVNLRLLTDGSIVVPLSAYITGTPSPESIQCLTDCRGWFLPLDALAGTGVDPLVIERARRIMAEQHYLSMERRLRMLQHKSAEERWRDFCAHMPAKIVRETPGYHVASYLGITPESLSRVRRPGPSP